MHTNLPTLAELQNYLSYTPNIGFFWLKPSGPRVKSGDAAGGYNGNRGYRGVSFKNRRFKEHRLVWLYETGNWPTAEIDHIDGNTSNNSFSNLREATRQQNTQNTHKPKNCTSRHKGVYWHSQHKKWCVLITNPTTHKQEHLGLFKIDQAKQAAAAYRAKELEYFGEFARKDEFIV